LVNKEPVSAREKKSKGACKQILNGKNTESVTRRGWRWCTTSPAQKRARAMQKRNEERKGGQKNCLGCQKERAGLSNKGRQAKGFPKLFAGGGGRQTFANIIPRRQLAADRSKREVAGAGVMGGGN